ncbi:MAG: phosphoenolpyruvate--protein phosphotransferase [Chloroflexi bacterium]|nr:MAG: phosphoenolpyruvate--protein phosphotransferase [Chloroflexota bacterium]
MQQIFSGLPAAPGVGIGRLYTYTSLPNVTHSGAVEQSTAPQQEWQRYLDARQKVDDELAQLAKMDNPALADIFRVHQEILHDRLLTEGIRAAIDRGTSAATATQQITSELVQLFQNLSDDYFASRSVDIRDVGQRLLAHLSGVSLARQLTALPPNTILLAEDLTPFDATHLSPERVTGIALAASTPTAHTAILARSLGIPLICGVGSAILRLPSGLLAVVDGLHGRLLVEPDAELLTRYEQTGQRLLALRINAEAHSHTAALTRDGRLVLVHANVNSQEDMLQVANSGADGIGLLRTEYLFQERTTPPTVTEQIAAYRLISRQMAGEILTVRLLDIGGDKPVRYLPQISESNPFLGVRGIRLLLQHPELLRDQLQALVSLAVKSSFSGLVRILVPMVSKVAEVHRVLDVLDGIPGYREGHRPGGRLQLGVMIEVPAAALLADRLAPLVDFFSIGSNDLAQYTLAADRVNSAVASLASPLDPSVLRLIAMTCQAGQMAEIPVSICGEMAGDPSIFPLLFGLGVTEVSVVAPAVALVKEAVRQTDGDAARRLAERALQANSAQEVHRLLHPEG